MATPPDESNLGDNPGPRNEIPVPGSPEPLEVEELQRLEPPALQDRFAKAGLRPHPGRTRHQLIVDLVRHAVLNGQQVWTSGFLEQPNDGGAMLRSPRHNFLHLPEDIGVHIAIWQQAAGWSVEKRA